MSYTRKKPKTRKTLKKRRWKHSLKGRKTRYGGAYGKRFQSSVSSRHLSKALGTLGSASASGLRSMGSYVSSKAASAASSAASSAKNYVNKKKVHPESEPSQNGQQASKPKTNKPTQDVTTPPKKSFFSSLTNQLPEVPSLMKTKKPDNIEICDLQDLRKYIKSIKKVKNDDELVSVSTYILRTLNERVNKEEAQYITEGQIIKYKDLIPDVMNKKIKGVIGRINELNQERDGYRGDDLKEKIKPVLEDILKILYPKTPASNSGTIKNNGNLQPTQIEEDALNEDGIANAANEKAARNAKNVSKRLAAETWKAKVKADYAAKSPEEKKATDDRLAAFQANAEKTRNAVATIIDPSDANPASITTRLAGEVVGEVPRVKNQTNSQVANTNGQQVQSGLAVRESRETPTTDESGEVAITGQQIQSGLAARKTSENSNNYELGGINGGRRKKSSKVRQRNRR